MTVLVGSGKGGVGKTSVTAGVSSALALSGASVICLDLDAGFRNLDLALGLAEAAVPDFGDYMSGRYSLDDILLRHPDINGLYLAAAPQSPLERFEPALLTKLLNDLQSRGDYVFIDCPPGIHPEICHYAAECDKIIVVATPNIYSLRDAQSFCALTGKHGGGDFSLVINRIVPRLISRNVAFDIDEIIDAVGLPLIGCIPEDSDVIACANCCLPVMLYKNSGAATAYANIASRLQGADIPLMKL